MRQPDGFSTRLSTAWEFMVPTTGPVRLRHVLLAPVSIPMAVLWVAAVCGLLLLLIPVLIVHTVVSFPSSRVDSAARKAWEKELIEALRRRGRLLHWQGLLPRLRAGEGALIIE